MLCRCHSSYTNESNSSSSILGRRCSVWWTDRRQRPIAPTWPLFWQLWYVLLQLGCCDLQTCNLRCCLLYCSCNTAFSVDYILSVPVHVAGIVNNSVCRCCNAILAKASKSTTDKLQRATLKTRTTKNTGVENAGLESGLENTGTSYVWVARRNVINIVRGYLRVVLKGMCSTSEQTS